MAPESGMVMRSTLGRVRGLGAAKGGVHEWWAQRVTAAALVPLGIWFVVSILVHLGDSLPVIAAWAGKPWNAVLLLAFLIALFRHLALGLKVVIDDYVHVELTKIASVLVMQSVVLLLWLAATISVLKVVFAG